MSEVERRTDEAFAASAWRDPRRDYRALLRALRQRDAATYETAVEAYRTDVETRLADASVDPVRAWLEYGLRLAQLAGGGRAVRVDEAGRSESVDALPAEPTLLLHLPADASAPGFVVAAPREPSAAQRATIALLVERRQALEAG